MDPMRDNVSTSEGQSYILTRSFAMNDRKTFDLANTWASNNLRRPDGLYSWLWGRSSSGKYQILDSNSASDADIDIAYFLISAYGRWKDPKYLKDGLQTINSIWDKETRRVGNYLILMPGAAQAKSSTIEVNPSYFAPAAFRMFHKYDKKHDWNELVDSSYYYLRACTSKTKTGLPPNWFVIDSAGKIVIDSGPRGDFSYDAIRVFFRMYLDYKKYGEKRAEPILEKAKIFITKWDNSGNANKNLYVNYKANGDLRDKDKFVGSIAILVPVINLYDKKVAAEIYRKEVVPYFVESGYWTTKTDYYGKNLLWFGEYMYKTKRLLK